MVLEAVPATGFPRASTTTRGNSSVRFGSLLLGLLVSVAAAQSVEQRVLDRDFPSVFQAWNRADNLPQEDPLDTTARHDLMWHVAGGYGMQWNASYEGLGESFTLQSIAKGRSYRQSLLSRNPNMVFLMEIRYRDAPNGFLPMDSLWWMRDARGNRQPGWEEGGYYLLNYPDPGFQAHVAAQCKAAVDSGGVDGVLLDWWTDDNDRLNLVRTVRNAIGYGPLIIVNSNQRKVPNTAKYVNGLFMEVYSTSSVKDWQDAASTLLWAEESLLAPRVNCLETWFHISRQDLNLMRATTTLSLTHSNGYCLFSDPNPLPVPDHLHSWYPFWNKETEPGQPKLGKPIASRVIWDDGVVTRLFQYGMAAYNAKGNGSVTLAFTWPVTSTASGRTAAAHVLPEEDGDIYVSVWPRQVDLNQDSRVTLTDFARLASYWYAPCSGRNRECSGADLDHSGRVDARDLLLLCTPWARSEAPPLLPQRRIALFEGFETGFNGLNWQRPGQHPWTLVLQGHTGYLSAKSGPIGNGQESTLQITLRCTKGSVSFYRRVSSETDFDFFDFCIDGTRLGHWSGPLDWQKVTFPVAAGTRTFTWTYIKDQSSAEGEDAAWIDDITFPSLGGN